MNSEKIFYKIALIRALEESLLELFSQGRIHGTTHTCIGQEYIPVALGEHLQEGDYLFCPHRCHGYYLSYGGSLESLIGEMMGKESGACGGRGGSQHLHYKRFFSSGVQGGIVGNAVGAALANTINEDDGISVVVLGDGTLGQGLVYESLNFAALKKLPVLFLLENNQYAQTTHVRLAVSGSMIQRALAFGMEADETQTNDPMELCNIIGKCVDYVRDTRMSIFQIYYQ